jgi:hypothetical protein
MGAVPYFIFPIFCYTLSRKKGVVVSLFFSDSSRVRESETLFPLIPETILHYKMLKRVQHDTYIGTWKSLLQKIPLNTSSYVKPYFA